MQGRRPCEGDILVSSMGDGIGPKVILINSLNVPDVDDSSFLVGRRWARGYCGTVVSIKVLAIGFAVMGLLPLGRTAR